MTEDVLESGTSFIMQINMKLSSDLKGGLILNFLKSLLLTNYKIFIFAAIISSASYIYYRIYNSSIIDSISESQDKAVMFFAVSLLIFLIITLRVVSNLLALLFGQKGEGSLAEKSKTKI
jgi:TRAP-type C4-dicarboxylate transport system permease small subunit